LVSTAEVAAPALLGTVHGSRDWGYREVSGWVAARSGSLLETTPSAGFTPEQCAYLEGLASGASIARVLAGGVAVAELRPTPDSPMLAAQDRCEAAGRKLVAEEIAKRERHPLDRWDEIDARTASHKFPAGTDVFCLKYHGLFYVAPAQDSYMCRLRLPGGILLAWQARGLADLAERLAGGYVDVTTRANLQLREISAGDGPRVLDQLQELGIVTRGSGADNVRNIVGSPTAGFDPDELIDTRPLSRGIHFAILQRRELYGLPRKFNIAFDGGGRVRCLEGTNDIGFTAVKAISGPAPAEVCFRMALGGITGHRTYASDLGVLLRPEDCVPVSLATLRFFLDEGDRSDRKKARFKYVIDRFGLDGCLAEIEKRLGRTLPKAERVEFAAPTSHDPLGHIGVHPQREAGRCYVGVVLPVGRITAEQLRGLADLAEEFGSRELRLTVWQNVLIPDVATENAAVARRRLQEKGLDCEAGPVRAGVVACTGAKGCKYAAADTKGHALAIADHLDQNVPLDVPFNLHVTGCHHSCAQHFVGDVGLLAAKVEVGDDEVEGFRIFLGGTEGNRAGGEAFLAEGHGPAIPAAEVAPALEGVLKNYLRTRLGPAEGFGAFCRRVGADSLLKEVIPS
jgi:ferredoxin-nitrite reductase